MIRKHMRYIMIFVFVFALALSGCGKQELSMPTQSQASITSSAAEETQPSSESSPPEAEQSLTASTEHDNGQVPTTESTETSSENTTPSVETASMTPVLAETNEPTAAAKNTVALTVGSETFNVVLYDNESASAFKNILPLTIPMSELHGNEKYYYLPNALPTDSENIGFIKAGDLMLYGSDCLVLFYESFSTSYSYTRLGYVEDIIRLADALGNSSVQVTLE